jgi:hypothetical protein
MVNLVAGGAQKIFHVDRNQALVLDHKDVFTGTSGHRERVAAIPSSPAFRLRVPLAWQVFSQMSEIA